MKFINTLAYLKHKSQYLYSYDNVRVNNNKIILEMQKYESSCLEVELYGIYNVLDLIEKIIAGIKCIHSNNSICGNLKPSNIFIQEDGNPIVADYCQNMLYSKYTTISHYNYFTTPEQLCSKEISENSDVYLCGLVFHFILSKGEYLFNKISIGDLIQEMEHVDSIIERSKISKMYKHLLIEMLKYDEKCRINISLLLPILYPERITQLKVNSILSIWNFYDNYNLKEKAINSILNDKCISLYYI